MRAENLDDGGQLGAADLNYGTEFLGEKLRENRVRAGRERSIHSIRMIRFLREFQVDPGVTGERHFDHGCKQTAVGSIMIRQDFPIAAELLNHVPEILQIVGPVDVRRLGADLGNHLTENGSAEAILAAAKIDEEQDGVADGFEFCTG